MTENEIKVELCALGRKLRKNMTRLDLLERDDRNRDEIFWLHEECAKAHSRSQYLLNDLKFGRFQ